VVREKSSPTRSVGGHNQALSADASSRSERYSETNATTMFTIRYLKYSDRANYSGSKVLSLAGELIQCHYWQGSNVLTDGAIGGMHSGCGTCEGVMINCEPSVWAQQPLWPENA